MKIITGMVAKCLSIGLVMMYLIPLSLSAGKPAPVPRGVFTFYLENDVFAQTDQNYTHGCGFAWMSADFSSRKPVAVVFKPFFGLLNVMIGEASFRNVSVSLRQNIYTPQDIRTSLLQPDDQPYAGITYFPVGFYQKNARSIATLELDVGLVGPHSFSDESQTRLHELIGSPRPAGWQNQLHDELVVNLAFEKRWRSVNERLAGPISFDFLPYGGAALGNMRTSANAGARLRVGWHLPNTFGSNIIQPGCECAVPASESGNEAVSGPSMISFHVYLDVSAEAIARDIFLDGNTFGDSPRVDKKWDVGRGVIGAGLRIHRLKLDYSYVFKTKTFRTQQRAHRYGGISIGILL